MRRQVASHAQPVSWRSGVTASVQKRLRKRELAGVDLEDLHHIAIDLTSHRGERQATPPARAG